MDLNLLAERLLPGEYPPLEAYEKQYPPRDYPKMRKLPALRLRPRVLSIWAICSLPLPMNASRTAAAESSICASKIPT